MVRTTRMGRMGDPQRGLLRAADQSAELDIRGAVANLYSTHRGRGGVSHSQERAVDPPNLASARRPRPRPYHGVLSRLRAVEDARTVAKPCGPWQQPTHHPARIRTHR